MTGFLRAGHPPTLVAALLYFDVSFMTWVLLGPLAPFLREDLGLSATQVGLITAIPLLGGSLFRPIMGILGDRIGGRLTGILGMVLTFVPLILGWQFATTATHLYGLGLMLGIAGASFAVALPLASRWYPPQYQGLAMGIAGDFTTMVVVAGSFLRPIGGWLSDRFGGYRLLVTLLGGFAVCLAAVAAGPGLTGAVALLFIGMGLLGMGNGAVFQLVPQRFPDRIGLVTGIVGAAGGLGGFFLPSVLGAIRDSVGSYGPGLAIFAAAFVAGTVTLLELGDRWSKRWSADAIRRTGVYSYRTTLREAVAEEN